MNNELLAEACRIEYDEKTDKLYIDFEVKNLLFKQKIKKEWTKDLEFIIVDKQLYESK